jgi:hypothetical protein
MTVLLINQPKDKMTFYRQFTHLQPQHVPTHSTTIQTIIWCIPTTINRLRYTLCQQLTVPTPTSYLTCYFT